ncbi:MAG: hypothetical protein FWC66_10075 [Oscillospiraceae bacterium]|nr:hypothetical protein [Oscillospiraceae bacterium]
MSSSSLKKRVIVGFLNASKMGKIWVDDDVCMDFPSNKVVVVSSGCTIIGDAPDAEAKDSFIEKNDDGSFSMDYAGMVLRNALKPQNKTNTQTSGNDGCFILENVTVNFAGNFTANFPQLTIFYDQVLAITVGPLKKHRLS